MQLQRNQQASSYPIGIIAGATTGAIAMGVYRYLNPLSLGSAVELATSYLINTDSPDLATAYQINTDSPPNFTTLALVGAILGAIAGAVRVAADRRFGIQQNSLNNRILDIAAGIIAAPIPSINRCMLFPYLEWKDYFIIHTFLCSAISGASAFAFTPVTITASIASRIANNKWFRPPVANS